jgi:hypothetical protein
MRGIDPETSWIPQRGIFSLPKCPSIESMTQKIGRITRDDAEDHCGRNQQQVSIVLGLCSVTSYTCCPCGESPHVHSTLTLVTRSSIREFHQKGHYTTRARKKYWRSKKKSIVFPEWRFGPQIYNRPVGLVDTRTGYKKVRVIPVEKSSVVNSTGKSHRATSSNSTRGMC